MTILEKLNLTDKSKAAMLASAVTAGRHKILEAIDNQIAVAKADTKRLHLSAYSSLNYQAVCLSKQAAGS